MIATAVPTRRREVLAIDMPTVLRPIWASVNPSGEIFGEFQLFRSGSQMAKVPTRGYLVRSWYSFKEAIPKSVAPVNTMMKITAPNEKRVVSDIYDSFLPARIKAPSAKIDGTHTPT